MTTIVTRLYETREAAERVAATLRDDGFPEVTLSIITEADTEKMVEARVDADAAERYSKAMTGGQALFVCRAPFVPFGAARRAMAVADSEAAIDAGVADENRHEDEIAKTGRETFSVLGNHPHILTREDYVGSGWSGWRASDILMWPTVSRRRGRPDNLLQDHRHITGFLGRPVLSRPRKSSVIPGGRHMSRLFWPMPLVRTGTKHSVLTDHPRITERLGFRTIIRR
ncbi:MAG: hypothetical protein ACOCTP_03935 [Roseicyclus sp.]